MDNNLNFDNNSNTANSTNATDLPTSNVSKFIDNEKKISQLEHELFLVSKQLEEVKELHKESSNQNLLLKDQLNSLEIDKLENIKLVQTLEKSINDLIVEKAQLQDIKIQLQSQKDIFESDVARLLNEKRRLADELQTSKADCAKERQERCLLQLKIDEFESEKNLIAYDKERWAHEKEILLLGKQWCMNEISERETKLNELRIEIMSLESKFNREKFTLIENQENNNTKIDELNEALTKKEQELLEIRDRLQKVVDERAATLNEMDSELRTKERLTELYKASLDAANKEILSLKENDVKMQNSLQENELTIVNLSAELEKILHKHEKELLAKDLSIKSLNEELQRANELIKLGIRSDEDIAALSPAAAAASNLIRSGISLTSIYAEHCRVVTELEKKTAENERIEAYVSELIQELDAKAPLFREQREFFDSSVEEVKRLNMQNKLLIEEHQRLQNERDSVARELSFTKAELERYQHEHHALTIQVRRLLFNIEKNSDATETDIETEEFLFSNIQELHKSNLDLITKVKKLEIENAEAIQNFHSKENDALQTALQSAEKELIRIQELQKKSELVINELTAQRDNYKLLYEDNFINKNNSLSNSSFVQSDKLGLNLQDWKSKAEFLQEKLDCFFLDKQELNKALNDRIDQQMDQISQLRTTNGKLESALEFQKKNQQLLNKSIDELNSELKKATEKINKLNVSLETLQMRNDNFTNQLLNQQQELSQLRVTNHTLEEQLQLSRSSEQRVCTELGILRGTSLNLEKVGLTLQEVETVLKRIDVEKETASLSQLQSLCIERDNLKNLIENMNRQHNQLTNSLKSTINSLTSERDKSLHDFKILQENFNSMEVRLKAFKEKYEKLTAESIDLKVSDDNIDGCKKEIQQYKNKCAYQEKQINELEAKCEDLDKLVKSKENELFKICSLSGNMENLIKEQNEFADLERQRLQAICNQHEENIKLNKKQIEELRNSIANFEYKILEKDRTIEHTQTQLQELENLYQQKCLEFDANISKNKETNEKLQNVIEELKNSETNLKCVINSLKEEKDGMEKELLTEKDNYDNLKNKINDLNVTIAKHNTTIALLEKEKLHLKQKISDYNQRDNENLEKTKTLYDEIQKLINQITFMEQMHTALPKEISSSNIKNSLFENSQQTDRFSTIIGYMRVEKEKETELRMNAELELQRIRSQTLSYQKKIGELEAELNQYQLFAQTNAQAAKEKESLISQLDAYRDAQQRYNKLKKEYDELKIEFESFKQKAAQLEIALNQALRDKSNLEKQISALSASIEARQKDVIACRQRSEQAMALASKYSPESYTSLLGDYEQIKQNLLNKEKEIDLLKDQLMKSTIDVQAKTLELEEKTKSLTTTNKLLTQTKTLARNFRDSTNKLEKEREILMSDLKQLKSELATAISAEQKTTESNSWTSLRAENMAQQNAKLILQEKISEIQKINAEKEGLNVKIKELECIKVDLEQKLNKMKIELDEANEKGFRMDSITSMLQQSRKKVEQLRDELKQKELDIKELKRSSLQLSTRKRTFNDLQSSSNVEFENDKRSKLNIVDVNLDLDSDEKLILDNGNESEIILEESTPVVLNANVDEISSNSTNKDIYGVLNEEGDFEKVEEDYGRELEEDDEDLEYAEEEEEYAEEEGDSAAENTFQKPSVNNELICLSDDDDKVDGENFEKQSQNATTQSVKPVETMDTTSNENKLTSFFDGKVEQELPQ